jgi:NitT/TauT family transport system permease protein
MRRRLLEWLPAIVVLVGVIALWEVLIRALDVQAFLLPRPSEIARTLWNTRHELWTAGWFTFQEALGGFVLGSGLAILVALVLARWRVLGTALLPFAIAANAIPIIAFAPITNTWFSPLNKSSKIVIAAVLCFFPVLVNTLRGLTSVNPRALELMHSYAASGWSILWKLRVPSSLPYLFTAFKISATASVVGAIIGEAPSSIPSGLGGAIINFNQYYSLEPKNLWATNLIAALLGITFFLAVVLVEKLVVRRAPEHLV